MATKKDQILEKVAAHPDLNTRISQIATLLQDHPEKVDALFFVKDNPALLKTNIENDLKPPGI